MAEQDQLNKRTQIAEEIMAAPAWEEPPAWAKNHQELQNLYNDVRIFFMIDPANPNIVKEDLIEIYQPAFNMKGRAIWKQFGPSYIRDQNCEYKIFHKIWMTWVGPVEWDWLLNKIPAEEYEKQLELCYQHMNGFLSHYFDKLLEEKVEHEYQKWLASMGEEVQGLELEQGRVFAIDGKKVKIDEKTTASMVRDYLAGGCDVAGCSQAKIVADSKKDEVFGLKPRALFGDLIKKDPFHDAIQEENVEVEQPGEALSSSNQVQEVIVVEHPEEAVAPPNPDDLRRKQRMPQPAPENFKEWSKMTEEEQNEMTKIHYGPWGMPDRDIAAARPQEAAPVKRKRGRPRKDPLPETQPTQVSPSRTPATQTPPRPDGLQEHSVFTVPTAALEAVAATHGERGRFAAPPALVLTGHPEGLQSGFRQPRYLQRSEGAAFRPRVPRPPLGPRPEDPSSYQKKCNEIQKLKAQQARDRLRAPQKSSTEGSTFENQPAAQVNRQQDRAPTGMGPSQAVNQATANGEPSQLPPCTQADLARWRQDMERRRQALERHRVARRGPVPFIGDFHIPEQASQNRSSPVPNGASSPQMGGDFPLDTRQPDFNAFSTPPSPPRAGLRPDQTPLNRDCERIVSGTGEILSGTARAHISGMASFSSTVFGMVASALGTLGQVHGRTGIPAQPAANAIPHPAADGRATQNGGQSAQPEVNRHMDPREPVLPMLEAPSSSMPANTLSGPHEVEEAQEAFNPGVKRPRSRSDVDNPRPNPSMNGPRNHSPIRGMQATTLQSQPGNFQPQQSASFQQQPNGNANSPPAINDYYVMQQTPSPRYHQPSSNLARQPSGNGYSGPQNFPRQENGQSRHRQRSQYGNSQRPNGMIRQRPFYDSSGPPVMSAHSVPHPQYQGRPGNGNPHSAQHPTSVNGGFHGFPGMSQGRMTENMVHQGQIHGNAPAAYGYQSGHANGGYHSSPWAPAGMQMAPAMSRQGSLQVKQSPQGPASGQIPQPMIPQRSSSAESSQGRQSTPAPYRSSRAQAWPDATQQSFMPAQRMSPSPQNLHRPYSATSSSSQQGPSRPGWIAPQQMSQQRSPSRNQQAPSDTNMWDRLLRVHSNVPNNVQSNIMHPSPGTAQELNQQQLQHARPRSTRPELASNVQPNEPTGGQARSQHMHQMQGQNGPRQHSRLPNYAPAGGIPGRQEPNRTMDEPQHQRLSINQARNLLNDQRRGAPPGPGLSSNPNGMQGQPSVRQQAPTTRPVRAEKRRPGTSGNGRYHLSNNRNMNAALPANVVLNLNISQQNNRDPLFYQDPVVHQLQASGQDLPAAQEQLQLVPPIPAWSSQPVPQQPPLDAPDAEFFDFDGFDKDPGKYYKGD